MKHIIFLSLLFCSNSFALRCGNQIIENGDSLDKVEQNCEIDKIYQVNNKVVDEQHVLITQGGMKYIIVVVDGRVKSIDGSRF